MAKLPCPRCGKVQEARTGKKYCDECRIIVRREQKASAARTFRKVHADQVKKQNRERDKDPKRKAYVRLSHWTHWQEHKNDPTWVQRNRDSALVSHDHYYFGGNSKAVFERDGGKCVVCGSSKRLDIHHKDGNGTNVQPEERNNSMDNLVLLCRSCHVKIHYEMRRNKTNYQ